MYALVISALVIQSTLSTSAAVPVVRSPAGTFLGNTDNGVDIFKGIRYARAARFGPPIAEPPLEGTTNATEYGRSCWQTMFAPSAANVSQLHLSEDCLFLNIWRPQGTPAGTKKLATMFWIHGGGLVTGSGGTSWTGGGGMLNDDNEGSNLARSQNVVVVTINYRLGPLGFFASDELRDTNGGSTGGANGVRDQISALEWVQRNVADFGGDPERVFVFGESAGSHSVGVLASGTL